MPICCPKPAPICAHLRLYDDLSGVAAACVVVVESRIEIRKEHVKDDAYLCLLRLREKCEKKKNFLKSVPKQKRLEMA